MESLESFNPENVGDDSREPIYNYEWVDEVMQALNVSSDISNAFQVCFLKELLKRVYININIKH